MTEGREHFHGVDEDTLDVLTSLLLSQLTQSDVLQKSADTLYLSGSHVIVQVSIRADDYSPKVEWFDIFVGWTDIDSRVEAVVSSMHLWKKGIADVVPMNYWVDLNRNGGKSWAVTDDSAVLEDIYSVVVERVPFAFKGPMVKAMQVLERLEHGLKQKFES